MTKNIPASVGMMTLPDQFVKFVRPVRKSIFFSGHIIRLIRSHSALTVRKPPAQATKRRYPGRLKAN